ncbi:MAG: hypothetical protein HRU15_02680 [Planctomycetes bacterium]|nr:hypothetical protein [Planctomycetota bacterium]
MPDPRNGKSTLRSERPWGDIHMVVRNQECSVDITCIKKGNRSSLHSHKNRYELFHLLTPGAAIEIDGEVHYPQPHDEFLLEPGMQHRFWATEDEFTMLVVCFGEWKAEDQIRHDDDYGRKNTKLRI